MSSGDEIARAVAGALAEAGSATGDGPLEGYLLRPAPVDRTSDYLERGEPLRYPVTVRFTRFSVLDRLAGNVEENEVRLMVAADREHPRSTDQLEVSGQVYTIVSADPFQPGGTPLYFDVRARR